MGRVTAEEYLANPCEVSSLPFYKTEQMVVPDSISVFREDEFDTDNCQGTDRRYFKLIHHLGGVLLKVHGTKVEEKLSIK